MATAAEIEQYSGNAGLGGGGVQTVAFNENNNMNPIQQLGKDMMLLNAQQNLKLYDQKVKDRDTMLSLLEKGAVSAGKIDGKWRPKYDEQEKKVQDSFGKISDANDTQGIENYLKEVTALKDVTDWAQYKTLSKQAAEKDMAAQMNDAKRAAYQKHIEDQDKKGFWDDYLPYQHTLDYDNSWMNTVADGTTDGAPQQQTTTTTKTSTTTKNGVVSTTKTNTARPVSTRGNQAATAPVPVAASATYIDPKTGLSYTTSTQSVNYGRMVNNANAAYLEKDGDVRQKMDMFRSYLQQGDPNTVGKTIGHMIERAGDYNDDHGYTYDATTDTWSVNGNPLPNNEKPDDAINIVELRNKFSQTPQGIVVNMSTPDLAALATLSNHSGKFVSTNRVWNEKQDEFGEKVRHDKAMEADRRARTSSYNRLIAAKINRFKTQAEKDQFMDNQFVENHISQPLISPTGKPNEVQFNNIKVEDSAPIFTLNNKGKVEQLQPIGGTPVYNKEDYHIDKKTNKKVLNKGAEPDHFEGGYYQPIYKIDGSKVTAKSVGKTYDAFKKEYSGWNGSFEDWLKTALQKGVIDVDYKGQNGTTNKKINSAAHMILAKDKKGNIFGDKEDSSDESIPTDEPESTSEINSSTQKTVQ